MSLSYLYVRKDLPNYISDPESQSLFVAFLKSFYDENYIGECRDEFGFVPITGELRQLALDGIDMLQVSPEAPTWVFEDDVMTEGGMGDYVISNRRKLGNIVEQDLLEDRAARTEEDLKAALARIGDLEKSLRALDPDFVGAEDEDDLNAAFDIISDFGDQEKRLDAAIVMGIVSLSLWVITAICMCYLVGTNQSKA